jgi:hypothetical protein
MASSPVRIDGRRARGRRVLFPYHDWDGWRLARMILRMDPVRRRQLTLLAECLLREDATSNPTRDDELISASSLGVPGKPPSRYPAS